MANFLEIKLPYVLVWKHKSRRLSQDLEMTKLKKISKWKAIQCILLPREKKNQNNILSWSKSQSVILCNASNSLKEGKIWAEAPSTGLANVWWKDSCMRWKDHILLQSDSVKLHKRKFLNFAGTNKRNKWSWCTILSSTATTIIRPTRTMNLRIETSQIVFNS